MAKVYPPKVAARVNARAHAALESALRERDDAREARAQMLAVMESAHGLGCIRMAGRVMTDFNHSLSAAEDRVYKARKRLQRTVDMSVAPAKTFFVDAAELDLPGVPCAGVVWDQGARAVVASAIDDSHGSAIAAALAAAIEQGMKPDRVVIDCHTPMGEVLRLCHRHGIALDTIHPTHSPVVAHGAIERVFRRLERLFRDVPAALGIPTIIDVGAVQ